MTVERRNFLKWLAASSSLALTQYGFAQSAEPRTLLAPIDSSKKQIAMLVYPDFTALDLVGPQFAFNALMGYQVHLVWKTKDVLLSDTGVPVQPTLTLAECPEEVDLLFVPGGSLGTTQVMQNEEVLDFLVTRAQDATFVTSVCTGALVLGAAGLLEGYRATTHWAAREILPLVGATFVNARVVEDRNRVTGAGITGGIDFALSVVAHVAGDDYAKAVQLAMEYAPEPPFESGTPEQADAATLQSVRELYAPLVETYRQAAE